MRLRELQERFFQLITAPEGVEKGLAALGLAESDVESMIVSDERRSAVERLDIYANMYYWRILDVLRDMYPRLVVALGDDAFHNLATDYLLAYPSAHPSLRNVGERVPRFLDEHPHPQLGWLGDLARLEWARHDVFDLGDAETLTMERLRALAPDEFASLPLRLVPALRVVELRWPADDAWQLLDPEGNGDEAEGDGDEAEGDGDEAEGSGDAPPERPGELEEAPRTVLVWRQDLEVYHRALDEREAEAIARIAGPEGASFGLLCEWLAGEVGETAAPEAAFGLLAQWATDGILHAA